MERLTETVGKIVAYCGMHNPFNCAPMTAGEMTMANQYPTAVEAIRDVLHKLAVYEDTGLTPEEVAELARVKGEGRLAVLPCKLGSKAYEIIGIEYPRIVEREIKSIEVFPSNAYRIVFSRTLSAFDTDVGIRLFFTYDKAKATLKQKG